MYLLFFYIHALFFMTYLLFIYIHVLFFSGSHWPVFKQRSKEGAKKKHLPNWTCQGTRGHGPLSIASSCSPS